MITGLINRSMLRALSLSNLVLTICLSLVVSISYAGRSALSDYPLGAGDTIKITVFGEPDLSLEARLNEAGTISYPLLGEIETLGKTIGMLAKDITDGLKDGYMVSPDVSVTVQAYRSFFIYGEVGSPGGYPFQPGLTLQQAIALAGGLTDRASPSKFYIVRESNPDAEKQKIGLSTSINPGDTITIEDSFF